MDDVLSDVFRLLRLKSCVYFLHDFHAPWGMRVDAGLFAQFHLVARGTCTIETDAGSLEAETGDVILFPHGARHTLADKPGGPVIAGNTVVEAIGGGTQIFAGDGPSTRLICGHFEYDNDIRHPLIKDLPEIIHVESFAALAPGATDTVVPMLIDELAAQRSGNRIVVERLAEVLLIQVLRAYFVKTPHLQGFLSAVSDSRLARAIGLIHQNPERPLRLGDLARAAGMSRSGFAAEFRAVTNLSPIAYLTQWRMYRARELLLTSDLPLGQIAAKQGYESDVAFSRAFKRAFAVSPASIRRAANGARRA